MRGVDVQVIEQGQHHAAQFVQIAALQGFRRFAVARQVQRNDPTPGRQRLVVEQPVVQVAAETMHQQHRRTALAPLEIADHPAVQLDFLRFRSTVFVGRIAGHKGRLELLDDRIDLGLAGIAVDHDA
nr:hypothetical protein GCM10020185_70690 [Pseudomonas brassicacearum subsp. brassicacearum]